MMLLLLLAAAQAATVPATPAPAKVGPAAAAGPQTNAGARFDHCLALAESDPVKAEQEASAWKQGGGKSLAGQCLGMAYAKQTRWSQAATAFGDAARAAELAKDGRSANMWAQSGNAWLAAGEPTKARAALDSAIDAGTLSGLFLGEARLDRARALVAAGDLPAARDDIDRALELAEPDPLAWLLSATLARRMDDLHRAQTDIAQALKLSADDASVQLEAGNIAALSGNQQGAMIAWQEAARIAPTTAVGRSATAALRQFADTAPKP